MKSSQNNNKKRKQGNQNNIGDNNNESNKKQKTNQKVYQKIIAGLNEGSLNKTTDFLDLINQIETNVGLKSRAYSKLSFDTNSDIILGFSESKMGSWARSIGPNGRTLVLEDIGDVPRPKRNGEGNPLFDLSVIVKRLITDDVTGTSVGAPGMSKANVDAAAKVTAEVASEHIRDHILGDTGTKVRNELRNVKEEVKQKAKENAAELIRRIAYPEDHLLADEIHAVGLSNDVLSVSWVNGKRTAAPYDSIAGEIDEINKINNVEVDRLKNAEIIAFYAGFTDVLPEGITVEDLNSDDGAKLREFATIQIAEKGRELKRIQEAGEGTKDLELVENALENAKKEGFNETYVESANEFAVFAQKGGQDELRKAYDIKKAS